MSKPAYMVISIDVHKPEGMGPYAEGAMPLLQQHGANVLAATNRIQVEDGQWTRGRAVLIEFPSMDAAHEFWSSNEYEPLKAMRHDISDADILLVEGMFDDRLEPNAGAHYLLGGATSSDNDWVDEYMQKVPPVSARFGVQPVASGPAFETLEGNWGHDSMVLLRFPDASVFREFWYGDDYAPMKALREAHTHGAHVSFSEELD